jgi:hypothetical protein
MDLLLAAVETPVSTTYVHFKMAEREVSEFTT